MIPFFNNIARWTKIRLLKTPEKDSKQTSFFILAYLITTTSLAVLTALGTPTGPSTFSHILTISKFIFLNILFLSSWIMIVSALLSLIYVPLPRILIAGVTYTITVSLTVFIIAKSGIIFSIIIGVIYGIITLLLGLLLTLLFNKNIARVIKIAALIMLVSLGGIITFTMQSKVTVLTPEVAIEKAMIDDPGQPGNYETTLFTYGSGTDKHRKDFGKDVNFVTNPVDASDFVTRWSKKRKKFWGFDQHNLPINGRVWMPKGDGPFPVMLIAHGNHTMEYLSTSGYDYLGEHLASRGIIMISVDEDFINYSNTYGSPNRNYELRTWIMLQHIIHLQEMDTTAGNFLSNKIDFQQVVYAGHSRGGQAALMAADYESFFPDDEHLTALENVLVKGVIAISPTDKLVDKKRANIHNTSYLLIHGARDADVSSFNDAPFYRTTFDTDFNGFKTSIYISDANHTHFNADWGSMDLSLPRGIFLNQRNTLSKEAQQQVAKVYVTAFLERIFHDDKQYETLFQNHYYGRDWLPDATYVNKYTSPASKSLITYNQTDVTALALEGFSKEEIYRPKSRGGTMRQLHALALTWKSEATYHLDIAKANMNAVETLRLTMANIEEASIPDLHVVIETSDGETHRLALADYMPFPPVIKTDFTWFGLFEKSYRDGKYEDAWEAVFQTFDIPIGSFTQAGINSLQLHFSGDGGKILIEEISVK